MKNGDRLDYAIQGALVGGAASVIILALFAVMLWPPEVFLLCVFFPIVAATMFIGWKYAEQIEAWLER